MDEQFIQCLLCIRAVFYDDKSLVLLYMQALFFVWFIYFSPQHTCKASPSDGLITPDKLVSNVSFGNLTDYIAGYRHICE